MTTLSIHRMRFGRLAMVPAVLALMSFADNAAAQHYEGCFVNGQQVSDAMCNGGTSGSGGGGADSAMMGAAGSLGFAIGAGIGGAIRNMLLDDNNGAPTGHQVNDQGIALFNQGRLQEAAEMFRQAYNADHDSIALGNYLVTEGQIQYHAGNLDSARDFAMRAIRNDAGPVDIAKQDLAIYNQAIATRNQAAAAQAQRQFAAGQQDLLDQIRPVHATPVVVEAPPHPVARMPGDLRAYPSLKTYTKDQKLAHDMNQEGIDQAELHHNWALALSNFGAAYDYDPAGPFSKVIRQNMEIAAKHLDAERAQKADAAATATATGTNAKADPQTAAAPAANAPTQTQTTDAQPKQVLPKTYAACNAELQSRTDACRRPDGSWDRQGCFDPAWARYQGCVKGLTDASFR
ncbi:MAG: tetratricopeptide repeat protein [Alphaproteobacteria bacterium]|nr:tetratricopeptide repeat protein [Alphaproteobacteria bacterium]